MYWHGKASEHEYQLFWSTTDIKYDCTVEVAIGQLRLFTFNQQNYMLLMSKTQRKIFFYSCYWIFIYGLPLQVHCHHVFFKSFELEVQVANCLVQQSAILRIENEIERW